MILDKEDMIELLNDCKILIDDLAFCYFVNGYMEMLKLYTLYMKLLTN